MANNVDKSQESIDLVKSILESPESPKPKKRAGYKEGLFYGRIYLALVVIVGLMGTYSTMSYYLMEEETYYTTDYDGDLRELNPYFIESR